MTPEGAAAAASGGVPDGAGSLVGLHGRWCRARLAVVGGPVGGDDEFVQCRSGGWRRHLRVGVHPDGCHELGKHCRERTFGDPRVDVGHRLRIRSRLFIDERERALRLGGARRRGIVFTEVIAGIKVVLGFGVDLGVVVEFVGVIEVRRVVILGGVAVVLAVLVVVALVVFVVLVVVLRLLATAMIVLGRGRRRRRPCALVGMGDASPVGGRDAQPEGHRTGAQPLVGLHAATSAVASVRPWLPLPTALTGHAVPPC